MGAQFQFTTINETDRAKVEREFDRLQDQDRYENGHSYSGGFGMADGLKFNSDQTFATPGAAEEWLLDNTRKWEAAIAVPVAGPDGQPAAWAIGAICSS